VRAQRIGADLTDCNCAWADLPEASLFGACLYRACLRNAKVCAADMRIADLRLANTCGWEWADTDLTKVIWTDKDLLDDARWD
jgi:uncharacterized protein YjbI with pentapeptide repeats